MDEEIWHRAIAIGPLRNEAQVRQAIHGHVGVAAANHFEAFTASEERCIDRQPLRPGAGRLHRPLEGRASLGLRGRNPHQCRDEKKGESNRGPHEALRGLDSTNF